MSESLNLDNVDAVVQIHYDILPDSIFSRLGKPFLRFFYKSIINDRDIFCQIYPFDNKVVGFLLYSSNTGNSFRRYIREHFFSILLTIVKTVINNPNSIKSITQAIRYLVNSQNAIPPHASGEIISFGVPPEFRVHAEKNKVGEIELTEFYKKHEIPVARMLFFSVMKHLNKLGINELRIMTPANRIS